MQKKQNKHKIHPVSQARRNVVAVDLFSGAGGLTRGLLDAGIEVVAGYDLDESCKFAYEHNNIPAVFYKRSVADINGADLAAHYKEGSVRVLLGCAPCQPFSKYTQGQDSKSDTKWGLLNHFARLATELKPDVLSMENVPELQRHTVYDDFRTTLEKLGYHVSSYEVYCPDYGVPQQRTRLVLFASQLGEIKIIPPTYKPNRYRTVASVLRGLPPLSAGEVHARDLMHRASSLSPINVKRIKHSKPGGTWREWPKDLVTKCHRKKKGKTYSSVYGRMDWDKPAPTITTQFFGFGNGRFGHPVQDRAISLREGALLQSFPRKYKFVEKKEEYCMKNIGRMIGNAVPVRLGSVIGETIMQHLENIPQ